MRGGIFQASGFAGEMNRIVNILKASTPVAGKEKEQKIDNLKEKNLAYVKVLITKDVR